MTEPTNPAPEAAASPQLAPPCRNLRFKGMYVYTDVVAHEEHDEYANTIYWCQKNLKDIGPDQRFVGRDDCCDSSRGCYQGD